MVIWIFICSPRGAVAVWLGVSLDGAVAWPALLGDVADGPLPVSPDGPLPSQPARVSPRTVDSAAHVAVREAGMASPRCRAWAVRDGVWKGCRRMSGLGA